MFAVYAQDLGSFPFNINISFLLYMLEQCYPIELSVIIEILYFCTIQYNSHLPFLAFEHLRNGYCN